MTATILIADDHPLFRQALMLAVQRVNLPTVQSLLGHTNIQNTVRYLGVNGDNAISLSERTEIRAKVLHASK